MTFFYMCIKNLFRWALKIEEQTTKLSFSMNKIDKFGKYKE
jgi:hypothetical protein